MLFKSILKKVFWFWRLQNTKYMRKSNLNTSQSINTGKVFKILNTKYTYSILSSNLNTCILNTEQHWQGGTGEILEVIRVWNILKDSSILWYTALSTVWLISLLAEKTSRTAAFRTDCGVGAGGHQVPRPSQSCKSPGARISKNLRKNPKFCVSLC